MKTQLKLMALVFAALSVVTIGFTVIGESVNVCMEGCEYRSIQKAIDQASQGDTVILLDEGYSEELTVNKGITLRGAGKDASTIRGKIVVGPTDTQVKMLGFRLMDGPIQLKGKCNLRLIDLFLQGVDVMLSGASYLDSSTKCNSQRFRSSIVCFMWCSII
ncbi:MAG: hypothetical protein ABEI54_04020 [Candidatus Bipolaricaulia bacterium]